MGALSSRMLVGNKGAGLALMLGVVLTIVASFFFPGGPLVDPVDQTDFPAAVAALGGQPNLGHAMTMLVIAGMLLYAHSFLAVYRLAGDDRSLSGMALRSGVNRQSVRLGHLHCRPEPATHGDPPHATQHGPRRVPGIGAAVRSVRPGRPCGHGWSAHGVHMDLACRVNPGRAWACRPNRLAGSLEDLVLRSCHPRSGGDWSTSWLRSTFPRLTSTTACC